MNYLYNRYLFPKIPEWDESEYPYAYILTSEDRKTTILWVMSIPSYVWQDSDGNFFLGTKPEGAYIIGYYKLTSSGKDWNSFVEAEPGDYENVNGNGTITVLWTNHNIINYDTGVVRYYADEPLNETELLFSYNGVKLPKLPYWDREKYPYAFIAKAQPSTQEGAAYNLYLFDKKVEYLNGIFLLKDQFQFNCAIFILVKSYQYNLFENHLYNPPFLETQGVTLDLSNIVWSNFNIVSYITQEILFYGTQPFELNENKEQFLYTLIKNQLSPESFVKGVNTALRIKNRTAKDVKIENGLIYNGIIPSGGFYYKGISSNTIGQGYSSATQIFSGGMNFPELAEGDVFVYNGYEYKFKYSPSVENTSTWIESGSFDFWGVAVLNREKAVYDEAASIVNTANVIYTNYLYKNCLAMQKLPKLPRLSIGFSYLCQNCESLTDISNFSLDERLAISLNYTFDGCKKLTEGPDLIKYTKIKEMPFTYNNCLALTKATIPSNVNNLLGTFCNCISMVQAPSIPDGVKEMHSTFLGCSSLEEVGKMPSKVCDLTQTFYECQSLETTPDMSNCIELRGLLETFYKCTSLININSLPPNITALNKTFQFCHDLATVDLSNYNNIISLDQTFVACEYLTNIQLPKNVVYLNKTFHLCLRMTNLPVLPNKVGMMNETFSNCTGLQDLSTITFPSSIKLMIGVFKDCQNVETLPTLPNKVKIINGLFTGCTGITDLDNFIIPDSVEEIGELFLGCTNASGNIIVKTEKIKTEELCASCFKNTTKSITLIGNGTKASNSILKFMKNTANNNNVSVS